MARSRAVTVALFVMYLFLTLSAHAEDTPAGAPEGTPHAGAAKTDGKGAERPEGKALADSDFVGKPKCSGYTDRLQGKQLDVMRQVMGSRPYRMNHHLWHQGASASTGDPRVRKALTDAFGARAISPNKTCPPPGTEAGKNNQSGEDFLFFHRQLIRRLNTALTNAGEKCIDGWGEVPGRVKAGRYEADPAWPIAKGQSAVLKRLKDIERVINDDAFLKKSSLSEVGWLMDFTFHSSLHGAFSSSDGRGGPPLAKLLDGSYDKKLDEPSNDSLLSTFSAHVNPMFWKLHGLVDRFVDRWAAANGFDEVAIDCGGRAKCYQWKGTWVGTSPEQIAKRLGPPVVAPDIGLGKVATEDGNRVQAASLRPPAAAVPPAEVDRFVGDTRRQVCTPRPPPRGR